VASLSRREIVSVVVLEPPAPGPVATTAPARPSLPPARPRHVGLHVGFVPSLMVDLEVKRFYGFANFNATLLLNTKSYLVPDGLTGALVTEDQRLWAFALGAGPTFKVRRWQFDVFAIAGGSNINPGPGAFGVVGVGVGAHYTARTGFALTFKLPLVGAAAGSVGGGPVNLLTLFYAYGLFTLPLVSLGYRF
jgi:hypothetical protein